MQNFIMLMGLPGSGKSTHAENYKKGWPNTVVVSSDAIREELYGDANDQTNPKAVFAIMLERSIAALKEGNDVIYDATNVVAKTRKQTLSEIKKAVGANNFVSNLVFIACSISECKLRQGSRDRKVPDAVIDRMARKFEAPWYNEGWDQIIVISGGRLQNIDREHWRMLGESHDNPHHTATLEMHCANCEGNMLDYLDTPACESCFDANYKKALVEAAYQHDLGKHKTKAFLDSRGNPSDVAHYYSHNNVGAYLWLSGDKRGQWDEWNFLLIGLLIQWHMQPYFLRDKNGDYRANFREWCDKKGFDLMFYESICLLHEADKAAH